MILDRRAEEIWVVDPFDDIYGCAPLSLASNGAPAHNFSLSPRCLAASA